jgi:hypothetical protein
MLVLENAKRIEIEIVNSVKGSYNRPIYIFDCSCKKELRVQKGGLARHSGKCVKCVKRNRHPYRTLYNCFLTSVRRANERFGRKIPITLTFEQFLQLTEIRMCGYCGNAVNWKEWGAGPYNLDRKNNLKGYSQENVIVCCFKCNQMKRDFFTFEEFRAILELLKTLRNGRIAP